MRIQENPRTIILTEAASLAGTEEVPGQAGFRDSGEYHRRHRDHGGFLAVLCVPLCPLWLRVFYSPSFSKNRQIVSIPWWKFGIWNFSFGAWRLSSGSPKPIMTDGIFSTSWKSVTIGIDPPERINTVSFLNVS